MSRALSLALVLCSSVPALAQDTAVGKQAPQGSLTGLWRGWYYYPEDALRPVCFQLVLVQSGSTTAGFIKEPNTFGQRREPWLHATFKGSFDEKEKKLNFTKTYDGTGGESHDVVYSGTLSNDGTKLEGNWDINGTGGKFTLERISQTKAGPLAGLWEVVYHYPDSLKKDPVKVRMVTVHHGQAVTGLMKEENNSEKNKDEPWLHAGFKGRFDEKAGKLTFTKSYDGTAGEDREVDAAADVVKQEEPKVDPARIDKLVAQLGSDSFAEREAASKALEAIGPAAYEAVQKATSSTDIEKQRRARDLLPKLEKRTKLEGTWNLPDGKSGRITLQKLALDERTLESLK
jgi:hypothetical protein